MPKVMQNLLVNALFTGILTASSGCVLALEVETVSVNLAQTGADGNFALALASSLTQASAQSAMQAGPQDFAGFTALCKQLRIFGRVDPVSAAANGHNTAILALKQVVGTNQLVRVQFDKTALSVANKTLPCVLRSHGLSIAEGVFVFAGKASVIAVTPSDGKKVPLK